MESEDAKEEVREGTGVLLCRVFPSYRCGFCKRLSRRLLGGCELERGGSVEGRGNLGS